MQVRDAMWNKAHQSAAQADPQLAEYLKMAEDYKRFLDNNWVTVLNHVQTGDYKPLLEEPFVKCLQELPWWRQPTAALYSKWQKKAP